MASEQAPVSAALSGELPEFQSLIPTPNIAQSNIEVPAPKSLKRSRSEQLLGPSGVTSVDGADFTASPSPKSLERSRPEELLGPSSVTSIVDAGFTASPSPKSPRFTGALSPRYSAAPLTGAAALEDERRRKESQKKNQSSAMSKNPSHKVLASLVAGGAAAMSKPQDAPAATTSMSNAMSTAANAISIPSPLHYDEKSETSPASVTSLASLGSTAQTATASTTVAASPPTILGPQVTSNIQATSDARPSNKALSFPGNLVRQQDQLRAIQNSAAARGMSLPMSASNETLGPPSYAHKKHKCPYCDTEFTRHHNLKSHLLTHSQEKPYICQTCQKRFRRLHDLKRHTKLHTGERPHICPKCDRKFARGDALARHSKGHSGCAGRRASTGSYGGDEDFDGSHIGEGDDSGMDGVIYAEPAEQNDGDSDEERRFSLPSIKTQHIGSGQGPQEVYNPHTRTPSTYPPAGPRPPRQRPGSGLYPPNAEHVGSGNSTSPSSSMQNSLIGGHSANTSLSVTANSAGNSIYAQAGMTESPKPLSPAGGLDPPGINRQRSPSLTTQFQQAHFGRRAPERSGSSPQGMSLPSPYASKLPAISGLAPPDPRYSIPGQPSSQQASINGNQAIQLTQSPNSGNPHNPAFQPHISGSGHGRGGHPGGGSHHHGSGSGDSSNNLFTSGDRGFWSYVQNLEENVKQLSERVASMENIERSQEDKIIQLSNELNSLRNHLKNPAQLIHIHPPQASQQSNPPNLGPTQL